MHPNPLVVTWLPHFYTLPNSSLKALGILSGIASANWKAWPPLPLSLICVLLLSWGLYLPWPSVQTEMNWWTLLLGLLVLRWFLEWSSTPVQLTSFHTGWDIELLKSISKELAKRLWFILLKSLKRLVGFISLLTAENSTNIFIFEDFALMASGWKWVCISLSRGFWLENFPILTSVFGCAHDV